MWWPIKLQPKDINFVHGQLKAMEEPNVGEHEGDGEDIATLMCGEQFYCSNTRRQ